MGKEPLIAVQAMPGILFHIRTFRVCMLCDLYKPHFVLFAFGHLTSGITAPAAVTFGNFRSLVLSSGLPRLRTSP